jgi:hypothetical protein
LWEAASGKELRRLAGHGSNVATVAFSPDGRFLASGGGKAIRLWDLATGKALWEVDGHERWVRFVTFSPDSRTLVSGGADHTLRLWEVATGRERHRFEGQRDAKTAALTSDGRLLATGSDDTTVLVWDLTGRSRGGRVPAERLTARELEESWAVLAGGDATKAYQAVVALRNAEGRAVALLREKLRPAVPVPAERLAEFDGPVTQPRRLQEGRAVEALEGIDTAEARALLAELAQGDPAARLTREAKASLERLRQRR